MKSITIREKYINDVKSKFFNDSSFIIIIYTEIKDNSKLRLELHANGFWQTTSLNRNLRKSLLNKINMGDSLNFIFINESKMSLNDIIKNFIKVKDKHSFIDIIALFYKKHLVNIYKYLNFIKLDSNIYKAIINLICFINIRFFYLIFFFNNLINKFNFNLITKKNIK